MRVNDPSSTAAQRGKIILTRIPVYRYLTRCDPVLSQQGTEIAGRGRRPIQIERANVARVERILARLDAAIAPADMNLPGWRFHALKGKAKGRHAVDESGNWRITFAWDGEDAIDVDLEDYH